MGTVVAEPAQWWTSDHNERLNTFDRVRPDDVPTTVKRYAHLVRDGHTLCGRAVKGRAWHPADENTDRCHYCAHVGPDGYTHRDVMAASGLTYRRLDHYVARGYLCPDTPHPGCGGLRVFPAEELRIARLMAVLTAAGLTAEASARVARTGHLASGVRVVIDEHAETVA